jgi:cell wall-associated NlpC family hydrolase
MESILHRFRRSLLLSPLLLLLIAGCTAPRGDHDLPDLLDLHRMPQNTAAYLSEVSRDLPLWPDQNELAEDYLDRHFSPWKPMEPRPVSQVFWVEDWAREKLLYGENLRPLESGRLAALLASAARESYPSLDEWGVSVRPTNCRALPTRRPFFQDPTKAGEGFPFDYLQNSAVPPNAPMRIRHRSADGAWVYAETGAVHGWFPAEDVAFIDEALAQRMRSLPQAVLVRDEVPLFDADGGFRFSARLGTFFPLLAREEGGYRVLFAAAGADGRALLREAFVEETSAVLFPLQGTAANIAALAGTMLGQAYAWGDQFGDRDCSSMVRDLYAPFGIWLPRNSSGQARAWRFLPLEELSPADKEAFLLQEGIPWGTLVWLQGHIMLYIGEHQGRAALLHAFWAVRTRGGEGGEGRHIVGRTVITTLQPGLELSHIAPDGDLLKRVKGMTLPGHL